MSDPIKPTPPAPPVLPLATIAPEATPRIITPDGSTATPRQAKILEDVGVIAQAFQSYIDREQDEIAISVCVVTSMGQAASFLFQRTCPPDATPAKESFFRRLWAIGASALSLELIHLAHRCKDLFATQEREMSIPVKKK